ncbi:MAG TPA: ester cyclase [Solirubrobacteraceae bacterium]|nr:ester cyclase [Solirubrobacteraceae bacterium]
MQPRELRLALTVEDHQRAVAFYRDALGLTQLADWSSAEGKVVLLDGGHGTLEIIDGSQAALIDRVEVGQRVAGPVRLALQVESVPALVKVLDDAGADRLGEIVDTPWGDRNARLRAPDGMQLTLFETSDAPTDVATGNKATFRRFHEATNTGDQELISRTIDEIVDPDVLIRTPLPVRATGAEALKEVFTRLHQAFPDLHVTVEDLIEEGDKVVGRNTVTGTHRGEYMGIPPTGKAVTYREIFIMRFADGRIAETWGVVDVFSQLKQLGAIP